MNEYNIFHHIAVALDKAKIWYYADLSGYIMEINTISGEMKCLFAIPDNTKSEPACRSLYYYNGKLYVLPYAAKIMYIYDLAQEMVVDRVVLGIDGTNGYYTGCIERNGSLYLYGLSSNICIYNMALGSMIFKQLLSDELCLPEKPIHWFWTEAFLHSGDIYILMNANNGLVKISANNEVSYVCLGTGYQTWKLRNIDIVKNEIAVLYSDYSLKSYCAHYDLTGRRKDFYEVSFQNHWEVYPYSCAEYMQGRWIVFPYRTDELIVVDSRNSGCFSLHTFNGLKDMSGKYYFGSSVKEDNGTVYAINQVQGTLVSVFSNALIFHEKKLFFSEEGMVRFRTIVQNRIFDNKDTIHETGELIKLDLLVKGLSEK